MRRFSIFWVLSLLLAQTACAGAAPARSKIDAALESYSRLADDGPEGRDPAAWRRTAAELEEAVRRAPRPGEASEALYRAGLCLEKAQALSRAAERAEDRRRAAALYERIIAGFPKSRAAPEALLRAGRIREFSGDQDGARACYQRILAQYADAPGAALARRRLDEVGRAAELNGVRAWSGPGYTRVVMDLSGGTPFEPGLLREDAGAGKPHRIFVDLAKTALAPGCETSLQVADGLVRQVRSARFSPTTVRVVLDLEGPASFRAFALEAPSRLVIDVFHPEAAEQPKSEGKPPPGKAEPPRRKLRIVIDPGHGGHDPGAIGPGNTQEKDVVLVIGKELAKRLRERLGCEVKLTRSDDRFLSLEERTAVANAFGADLFLSIHANASRSPLANGIETYFLERSSDRAARRLAGRENATGEDALSGIEHVLADLLLSSKVRESERLARSVHAGLVSSVQKHYQPVRDLGVKRAPFYVLTGAMMPAVLVETAFISNPVECRRLSDSEYRDRAVEGLVEGVLTYVRDTESAETAEAKRSKRVF
ncbi:MAG: N-acetylmuramoyl-L-alanine amidase [Deltaproteobacteria bacterium]|nr:N-acetylmuramoyl-L-alanine amidase [Deltaproteobacteria bacterium]